MINSISINLEPMAQTARKPDVATTPVGVTGASASTAPQTSQAVKTLTGAEKLRGDGERPFDDKDSEKAAEKQAQDNTRFEINLDESTGKRVFKRVVTTTGHVLWQEPEDKLLQRARERNKATGVFTDKTV
jgi:hypothetical protein